MREEDFEVKEEAEEDQLKFSDPRKYPEILSHDRKFLQKIENHEHPNTSGNKFFWKNTRSKKVIVRKQKQQQFGFDHQK